MPDILETSDVAGMRGRTGDSTGSINIAELAVDRHVRNGHGTRVALRWIGRDADDIDEPVDLTYEMLARRSGRFAAAMRRHGLGPGSGVASLTGRTPDLYTAALGTLRAQAVFTPLLPTLEPDAVVARLHLARSKVLVTTPLVFRRTVSGVLDRLPHLELVLVCGSTEDPLGVGRARSARAEVMSYGTFLTEGFEPHDAVPTAPDTAALLHFTGGTQIQPAVTAHTHAALVGEHLTAGSALDLHDGDTVWCTADPGSATAASSGIVAALMSGVTTIVDEPEFDARRCRRILERHRVDVLYTTTTAMETLRRTGAACAGSGLGRDRLRLVAVVGGPLDTDTEHWGRRTFGAPVRKISDGRAASGGR